MLEGEVEKFLSFYSSDFGRKIIDREADIIDEKLRNCDKALSIGCGIGSIGEMIENFEVVYLDHSFPMVSEAKNRGGEEFLVVGEAEKMPFRDDVFDCAYSVTGLEFMRDLEMTFREIDRILDSDGNMLAMMLNSYSDYFKSHVEDEESYFSKIRYHPKQVAEYMEKYFSTEREYFLGIEEEEIFTTDRPEKASLYVVSGEK